MKTSRLIRKGIEILRGHRWYRGTGSRIMRGSHCMMTAIPKPAQKWTSVVDYLRLVCGISVVQFNDHHCRRKRDAIAAMEIAADLAEYDETQARRKHRAAT